MTSEGQVSSEVLLCPQVKLAYQESEVVSLLKKIPLGVVEMSAIRERAEQLRDGNFCDYRPVLPLMLASFIFDVLCTPGEQHRSQQTGSEWALALIGADGSKVI